ncbi:phage tail terminator family protein [Abyssisolibacter fermentans]|uniref:phage tail terminator family protein n=1 Tax=Abyssisolibacter fermentans TaxID=1766203 RepID=UPI00083634F3|nr:hypothetical protein [Abyssisolibacter fermentans]
MKLIAIKNAVIYKLTTSFPEHNIYGEDPGTDINKPALLVQLNPIYMNVESRYQRRKNINISIKFHSVNGTNDENIDMIDKLYETFDSVLAVEDRVFNIRTARTIVKDNILRYSFNLDLIDNLKPSEEYELMKELEIKELQLKEEI